MFIFTEQYIYIYIYMCVCVCLYPFISYSFHELFPFNLGSTLGVSPVAAPSWNPQTQRSTDAAVGQSNRLSKGPGSGMKFMS